MSPKHCKFVAWLGLFIVAAFAVVVMTPKAKGQESGTFRITPEMLGLPDGNTRSAEPDEVRVYTQDENGKPKRKNPGSGYPIFVEKKPGQQYSLRNKEVAAFHGCIDFTSKPGPGKNVLPEELPFKAGVFGKVTYVGDGIIRVTLLPPNDGVRIEYIHVSGAKVKRGEVGPNDFLGVTGKELGASQIHLHIQAKDKDGRLLDPDRAFALGRVVPGAKAQTVDVGPMLVDGKKPKVVDGVVKADEANKKLYYDEKRLKDRA